MISLKNLEQASEQEVFDQAARHLLQQKRRAADSTGKCLYRKGNLKCAGGCFISDDEYDEEFENQGWYNLQHKFPWIFPRKHLTLIHNLQSIHDKIHPEYWKACLTRLAESKGLETFVAGEFPDD